MDSLLRNETRAAVQVEYVVLIVVCALAVVGGVGYLAVALNDKPTQVADALESNPNSVAGTEAETNDPSPTSALTLFNLNPEDGTFEWTGGTAPYSILRAPNATMSDATTSTLTETRFHDFEVPPSNGVYSYRVVDSEGATSTVVTGAYVTLFVNSESVPHGLDNATVRLQGAATEAYTDYRGNFSYFLLPLGEAYVLDIECPGYQPTLVTIPVGSYTAEVTLVELAGDATP